MDIQTLIAQIAVFVIAALCLLLSVMSFLEKGVLINNAWLWASKEEKARMDKRPYYRQSAVIFLILTGVFASLGVHFITNAGIFMYISIALAVTAICYVIASSVKISLAGRKQ